MKGLVMFEKRSFFVFVLILFLSSCGGRGKTIVKNITDVAFDLCTIFATDNPTKLGGLTPRQFCDVAENLKPFVDATLSAKQQAGTIAVSQSSGNEVE